MFKTRAEAVNAARELQFRMKTGGWKIRVWHNFGWHFELRRGSIQLSEYRWPHAKTYFRCLMGAGTGGQAYWLDDRKYADPNRAVAGQLRVAIAFVRDCRREVRQSVDISHLYAVEQQMERN